MHDFNSSTEAETGGSEFKASLIYGASSGQQGYTEQPCLRKKDLVKLMTATWSHASSSYGSQCWLVYSHLDAFLRQRMRRCWSPLLDVWLFTLYCLGWKHSHLEHPPPFCVVYRGKKSPSLILWIGLFGVYGSVSQGRQHSMFCFDWINNCSRYFENNFVLELPVPELLNGLLSFVF